ncbi:DtxR family transcriptional regulator, Mn-dependent transcriptional regulator [Enterococcus sp. AZ091]|uniref:metal-dependent transcriptional regulator n=1 Tax=Enterococcus TaxID=1350 RepID=UPI00209012B3|nr:metal-dependent transcriptional regulator [Enterococcus gallinarum]MCO5475900.1 metal-dependent transcriptional regulator [Enterococcus gallinarum]
MTPIQEKYLLVIEEISAQNEIVKNSQIAKYLNVKPSSVTEMVERLSDTGMVKCVAYKGIILTDKGKKELGELKKRCQIMTAFLKYQLGCSEIEIENIMEEFIQIKNPVFLKKLDLYIKSKEYVLH